MNRFGSEKNFSDWLHSLKILVLLLSELIEKNLKGSRLSPKELENTSFLKWSLIKKGLITENPSVFLRDPILESRILAYNESNNENNVEEKLGVAEEGLDFESLNVKLKALLKQSPELQHEVKEDGFNLLRSDLRSRILKDRVLLPEEIRKKLDIQLDSKTIDDPNNSQKENKMVLHENDSLCEFDEKIKECLNEIELKKGGFFDIISQIKNLYPEPSNLRSEKIRPRFLLELKKQWEHAENLIILAFLYHNGSLSMNVNAGNLQYFKEQLNIIGKKKNNVLEWMIGQVQNEREWQFAVQELEEIQKTHLANKASSIQIPAKTPEKHKEIKEKLKSKTKKKINLKKKEEERKQLEEKQEEKKEEVIKKPEIDEKLEKELWNAFQHRYENNFDSIRNLCLLKNIQFTEEDPNIGLKEFFNICKATLASFKPGTSVSFESPYKLVADSLIAKCLFLLRLGSYYSSLPKDHGNNISLNSMEENLLLNSQRTPELHPENVMNPNNLNPPGLGRSISCQVEEKILDKEKLESFRSWIDSYQKWKVWQGKSDNEDTDLQAESYNAYNAIGSFLCSKAKTQDLEHCLLRQNHRCGKRVLGMKAFNSLYEKIKDTSLEKYLLGLQCDIFKFDGLRNIKCSGKRLKELNYEPFMQALNGLITSFNHKFIKIERISLEEITVEINKVKMGGKFSELDQTIKEYLKLLYMNLLEICSMVSTNIPISYWENWIEEPNIQEFYRNNLNLAIFTRSLSFLSPNFEDLTLITQNISQMTWLLGSRIAENWLDVRSLIRISSLILSLIAKEFGLIENKDLVNIRALPRLSDLATIQRLDFLLSLFFDVLSIHESRLGNKQFRYEILNKDIGILFHLLYFLNQPSLIRLLMKSLILLAPYLSIEGLQTVYDLGFFAKLALNYDDLAKNNKAQNVHQLVQPTLFIKEIPLEKPQASFNLTNLSLIIEKLGQAILLQEDPKSLRKVLDSELSRIIKDLDYSKTLISSNLARNYTLGSESLIQDPSQHKILTRDSKHCSSTSSLISEKKPIEKSMNLNKDTVVLIQLSIEEDVSFMVNVLYYWEEVYPSFSLKYPKTLEEFYKQKEEKVKKENEQKLNSIANSQNIEKVQPNLSPNALNNPPPSVSSIYSHRIFEKLIINQPDFNLLDDKQENLPFSWFLNYMGVFPDLKCPKTRLKTGKSKKCVKKVWANTNLLKLEKKYEALIKAFEEIKETDSQEDKVQTLMARNFIARMMHHIKDVKNIATMLNVFGFAPVLSSMPTKKASELGYMIHLGINTLLKPINLEHFKEDIKKKLDPNVNTQPPPQNPPQPIQKTNTKMLEAALNQPKSQMVISMCDQTIYQNFDFTIDFVTSLTANKDSFYTDCNKFSIVHRPAKSGSSNSSLIHELIEFLRVLAGNNKEAMFLTQKMLIDMLDSLNKEERWLNLSQFDRNFFVGLSNILGGWTQTLRTGALTSIKNLERDNLCIVTQGGYTSGRKHCNIVSIKDPALIVQTVNTDQLELRFQNEWPKKAFELNYQNLLENIRFLYNSFLKAKITGKEDLISLTIMLRSLLKIASIVDWNPLILKLPQENLQILITILLDLCHSCPVDKSYSYHEEAFANSWEKLVDKLDPSSQLFSIPQGFDRGQNFYDFELEAKKPLVSKPSEVSHGPLDSPSSFVLPLAAYIESLPEHQQTVSENKMLKYWEKHIIPRIQDFVRSSLKPWEFEDFFEQLRQPLRKGDQAKAAEVAYILCDQRLPAGVVLPDLSHDWNTITIEEVQIGQWAIAKLHSSNNQLYSQFFLPQVRLGNIEVCVQMLAVDSKSNSVLVMFQDHENNQLISIWLPVLCLKLPEIPLSPHVACLDYETVSEEFLKCMNNSVALLSRQVLLKFFSIEGFSKSVDLQKEERLLKQFNLPLIEIIKWSVLEELSEDPVEGWLEANELNYLEIESLENKINNIQTILQNRPENKYNKLREIQVFLNYLTQTANSQDHIKNLMSWLQETFPLICEYIPQSSNHMNLYRASLENSNNPFPLNTFVLPEKLQDSISALCVSFKQEATLCLCSGLKFYSDESGINVVHHIPAGKEARSKLKPLLFKMSQVYCSYYFNAEALPPYQQNQTSTTVPSMISGIPSSWSVCCWLLDSLGTSFMLSGKENAGKMLAEINKILVSCMEKLKVPAILRELLAKLLIRNLRKLHHVLYRGPEAFKPLENQGCFELKGLSPEFAWNLVEEVVKLKECQSLELYILYSSYIQQLMELSMTIFLPFIKETENIKSLSGLMPEKVFPEGFQTLFNVLVISGFIREESHLTRDLYKECLDNIKLETQWDRLIYIENLPQEWSIEYIINSLGEIITKNKGRVLLPNQDLYLPYDPITKKHKGICMILLDGWAVMDIEDVVSTEKKEENANNNNNEELFEENKEEASPEIPEDHFWICEVCTLENSEDLVLCSACESPKPAKKAPVVSEKEIAMQMKRNDLSEVEKEIQKKDQLRFERFLQDLNGFVQRYYDEKEKEKETEKEKEKDKEKQKQKEKEKEKEEKKEEVLKPEEVKKRRNKENKQKKKLEKMKKKEEIENLKKSKKEQKKLKKKLRDIEENEENEDRVENPNVIIEAKKEGAIEEKKEGVIEEIQGLVNEEKKEGVIEEKKPDNQENQPINKQEEKNENEINKEKNDGNQEIMEEKKLENEKASGSPLISPFEHNKDDALKSPEFSRVPDEFPSAKKCVVLFGSHIFENKTANSCLKEMLRERCLIRTNPVNSSFKPVVLKLLKSIYHEIIAKLYEKSLKEKLVKFTHMLTTTSFEDFSNGLLNQVLLNPLEFWKFLEVLGFDFWGTNSGFHPNEKPQLIPLKQLSELMKYIETDLCQETKAVLTFSALNIRLMNKSPLQDSSEKPSINYFNEITLENKYYHLYKYQVKDLRFAWSLLKIFNANLIPSISFINMKTNDYCFDQIWLSLSTYLSCLREIWMMPIKRELSHKVLQKTAVNREEVPKVILERLKLNRESGRPVPKSGISIKNKDDFIFSKSHEQLKEISTTLLRPLKPQGAEPHISFEVIFKGENVMGEAGPYRQHFADISMELQPSALNPYASFKNLNLLCPSPNNDAKLGRGRDKFVINPSAKSAYHLQLFEFLGILMGCSVRTGTHLTLDLPMLFWKQLVGQKVEFEDLEEVDESLKDLVNIFQNYSRVQFEETIMETFSTTLSNKTVVELKKGGNKIPVLYEDRFEYVQKVLHARMRESILQIEAIKKGLTLLIPLPFLNGMSAKDLEIWVSGKPKVNIELLRRHTRYAGDLNDDSRRIKFLWEVLGSLKENEKLRFVKFCWGQERLPANDEEFERTQTRFMVKPANYASSNPDKALPKADTCFFNLELPDYSTKEVFLLT